LKLSAKMERTLALCSQGPFRFSDLKRQVGLSDAGLWKNLLKLESAGFLEKSQNRYVTTEKGREAVRGSILAEEVRKQKLVKSLLVLQQVVRPTEVFSFESLRILFKQKPLTLTRYEALAVIEGLQVTSDSELDSTSSIKVYANILRILGATIERGKASSSLTVCLDLNKGFDLAERRLEREIEEEWDKARRKKLQTILTHIRNGRDALIRDVQKRFLQIK